MNIEEFIRRQVTKIILEEKEKDSESSKDETPPPRETRRSRGDFKVTSSVRGAIPKGMRPARPEDILKNLGAKGRYDTGEAVQDIHDLMKAAITGAEPMQKAYSDVKGLRDSFDREGVLVKLNELDPQNGTRFLKITIEAAQLTGALKLQEDIRVEVHPSGVLIYESKAGRPSWNTKK